MKIYPVVHLRSPEHALELSQQALEVGADGVFLIDHLSPRNLNVLDRAYNHVRRELGQSAWIGVNYLALSPSGAVNHMADMLEQGGIDSLPNAFWVDDGSADHLDLTRLREDRKVKDAEFFGGVAFKYTDTYTDNPSDAAGLVRTYGAGIDVVTTSGPGTGYAADARKVAAMKAVLGDRELALASGVSISNIEQYRFVDRILAASSIETASYSGIFVDRKLNDLVQAAHRE